MSEARRRFLRLALGTLVAGGPAALWRPARAQSAAAGLAVAELRDGLHLITGAGGNVVLCVDGTSAALVDSGAPEHADPLAALVKARLGGARLEWLVNTHWHLEHTGGNEAFAQAGATIVAHENTRLWMSTRHYVDWQDRTYEPRPAAALPTETFHSHDPQPGRIEVGATPVEYAYLRDAHTDGDLYVFFPAQNVLVAGGAVSAGAYPVLDYPTGGWIGGLVDATQRLLEIADAETLIVPAAGPAQRRAHLEAQLELAVTLRERVSEGMRQGSSVAELLEAGVTRDFDAAWGDNGERFVFNVYGGLWWQGRLDGSL